MAGLCLFIVTIENELGRSEQPGKHYIVSLLGGNPEDIIGMDLVEPGHEATAFQPYSFSQRQLFEFQGFLEAADDGLPYGHKGLVYKAGMRLWFDNSAYGDVLISIYEHEEHQRHLFMERVVHQRQIHGSSDKVIYLERARLPGAGSWLMKTLRQAGNEGLGSPVVSGDTRSHGS